MCVASKFKHIYFGWSKKNCKMLCAQFELSKTSQHRGSNLRSPPVLRFIENLFALSRLRAIDYQSKICREKYEKQKTFDVFKQKSNMNSKVKNVFVRFFFTLEIFSFIDNPNNPFRWLVKIAFFCFMLVLLLLLFVFFIDDVCDVVTNTTDKGKRNAQVFAWKKSLSSPKRKYCLIRDYMSVQCKCVACIFRSFSRRIECFFFFLLVMNTFIIWRYSIVALLTIKRRGTIEIDNMSFFVRVRVCALSMDVCLLIRKTNAFIYFFIEDDEQTPRHARQVLSLL